MANLLLRAFLLVALAGPAVGARADNAVDLGFLEGAWSLHSPDGKVVGTSVITAQWPGAVLFEQRSVGEDKPQPLWLVNMEADGWRQLFVGVAGTVRQFKTTSPPGKWPLVLTSHVVLRDGTPAVFRLTLTRRSDNESRRLLERSLDDGATWTVVFDYTYRRKQAPRIP